jgi:tetratricopeptide (TPR) repeat protein
LNLLESKVISSDDLLEIAKASRVQYLLKSSYSQSGDDLVIAAYLIDGKTAETLSSFNIPGEGMDHMPMLDSLNNKIKQEFLSSSEIYDDIDLQIETVMTSNRLALEYYFEADKKLLAHGLPQAKELINQALELDPEFAMAYLLLYKANLTLGPPEETIQALHKAFELKESLPLREKYLIEAEFFDNIELSMQKAIGAFKKAVEIFPDDKDFLNSLARRYKQIREFDKAIEIYEKLYSRFEGWGYAEKLAESYYQNGEFEKAEELLLALNEKYPDSMLPTQALTFIYIAARKYDLASSLLDKRLAKKPNFQDGHFRGFLCYFQDDFIAAETRFQNPKKGVEKLPPVYLEIAVARLFNLYIAQGKFGEAFELIKQYRKSFYSSGYKRIFPNPGYYYLKVGQTEEALKEFQHGLDEYPNLKQAHRMGLVMAYVELNELEKAEKMIDIIDQDFEEVWKKYWLSKHLYLKGLVGLKRGELEQAIDYLEKSVSALLRQHPTSDWETHAVMYDALASAYLKNGDLDNAIKNYETISTLTWGRFSDGDIYAKSFYQLGKIYQEVGLRSKAIENYEKFIDLWKDCDPQFQPMVQDARDRIETLKQP